MTLRELRVEYGAEVIGPAILDEVRRACASLARRYPPHVYARSASWDEDAIEELVQDVVVGRLLAEHQIAYLFDVADRISDWRALLNRQVKITLARRRVRTVVDNLLERARRYLVQSGAIDPDDGSGVAVFRGVDAHEPYRALTDQEVRKVAEHVRAIPRRRPEAGERAPTVYTKAALESALHTILRLAPGGVAMRDVARILEYVLTDWVPTVLELDRTSSAPTAVVLSPEEDVEVKEIASELLASLSEEEAEILRGRIAGLPDNEIARWIGVSRPTLYKRWHVLVERLRATYGDLDDLVQDRLMEEAALSLSVPGRRKRSDG